MKDIEVISTHSLKLIGGCLLHNGILYKGADTIKCLCKMMELEGRTFEETYGVDPNVDIMFACDVTEATIANEWNGVIGIDILEKGDDKYFVVFVKPDALNKLHMLDEYAKKHDYKFACYLNGKMDVIYVPKPASIVIEVIEV